MALNQSMANLPEETLLVKRNWLSLLEIINFPYCLSYGWDFAPISPLYTRVFVCLELVQSCHIVSTAKNSYVQLSGSVWNSISLWSYTTSGSNNLVASPSTMISEPQEEELCYTCPIMTGHFSVSSSSSAPQSVVGVCVNHHLLQKRPFSDEDWGRHLSIDLIMSF